MQDKDRTREQLAHELGELRKRVADLEASEAESKQVIELLFDCKEKYYAFFQNSRDALYINDRASNFVDVNQSFLDLFGYTREELGNLKAGEMYVNKSDRRRLQREIEQRGLVMNSAVKVRKKDGTQLDCLITATARHTDEGSIVGYQGIIRDTTDHKRMEKKIKENERRYLELAHSLPIAVFETDESGNFAFINDQGLKLSGYTPEDIDNGLNALQLFIPEDRDRVREDMRRVLGGEKLDGREYTGLKKDGSIYSVIIYVSPIIVDNRTVALRGIVVDVTERKQAEKKLRIKKSAIASSINAIAMADLEGNLTYVNPSFLRMWEYEEEQEVLGRSVLEFWQKSEGALEVLGALRKKGGWIGEFSAKRKDGFEFCVQLSSSMVTDERGKPLCMMGSFIDITDRERAEEALQESRERFRSLVEATSDWIWEMDQNGVYTYASPKVKDILGYEPQEVIGKTPFDLMSPDEAERIGALFRDIMASQRPFERLENENLHKDGRRVVVLETSGVPIFDAQGILLGYRGIDRDITEARRVQEKVKRLSSAVEQSIDGIAIGDLEPKLIYVNEAFARMHDYSSEELLGMKVVDLHNEDQMGEYKRAINQIKTRGSWEGEIGHIRKDGTPFLTYMSVTLLKNADGKPTGTLAVARDITEQKRVEEDLQESRLHYRALFENAPVGIGLATIDGHILAGNQAMHQISGNTEADMGKIRARDFYENSKDRKLLLRRLLRGEPVREFEVRMKRKDGTPFDASLTINRITVDGKDVILTMIRDITAHKESEKKLLDYQQQLRSLATELSLTEERGRRRIATFLHDHIGHSLAMCKIKLGLLRESLPPIHQDGYLEEIKRIIEQVIQHTRSLTGELSPPVLYELGLAAAVEWLAENVGEQYGIQVTVKNTRWIKKVNGNNNGNLQTILFQATRELLTNIVKHAQAQKVEIYIRRHEKDKIRIDVKDDGVGFDTSHLLSNITKNGGFGLFNIRERFNHLGGHLDIQSQPGCGTYVTLIAPLETME